MATDPGNYGNTNVSPVNSEGKPHTFIESDAEAGSGITGVDYRGRARPQLGKGGQGSSLWTYQDDSDSTFKTEGSYRGFTSTGTPDGVNEIDGYFDATGTASPHGSYTTTSNKCKICHAVHRAEGAFKLMRADAAEDACSYCHIGDHRHTYKQAYSASSGDIHPSNGHTIGAGKDIPDSSTWQWIEPVTLASGDDAETGGYSATINVRRYNTQRNKLMAWTWNRASDHSAEIRWGPTLLTCMSCHQPHNAQQLVWKPTGSSSGYKLLRGSPSGSIKNKAKMEGYTTGNMKQSVIEENVSVGATTIEVGGQGYYGQLTVGAEVLIGAPLFPLSDSVTTATQLNIITSVNDTDPVSKTNPYEITLKWPVTSWWEGEDGISDPNNVVTVQPNERISVPNASLSLATTGRDGGQLETDSATEAIRSIYTAWKSTPSLLNSAKLSVWCADCHNLNIAAPEIIAGNFRGSAGTPTTGQSHSDRSHSSGADRLQCYMCHRSDLPSTAINMITAESGDGIIAQLSQGDAPMSASACNKCHFYDAQYTQVRGISDFPHAGDSGSDKLLKDGGNATGTPGNPIAWSGAQAYDKATDNFDSICVDCHDLMGEQM
ncbi:MAG: hypothetical protein Q8L35_08410 [Actinomycetota bacterium]|nr:hypothetical protein [Actinomycetota bacterium]